MSATECGLVIAKVCNSQLFNHIAVIVSTFFSNPVKILAVHNLVVYNSVYLAELIYDIGGEYKFISPFFREWVRRRK